MNCLIKVLLCAILATTAVAHPGEDLRAEIQRRRGNLDHPDRRTLASCTRELEESGYYKRELIRRFQKTNALRADRGNGPIHSRDIDPILAADGPLPQNIASRQQRAACVLDPEVTEGPYWVSGELIRSDVLEGAVGVQLHLDINVIDVTTCQPIPNVFVELWGANSTGVYTGVVSRANGVGLAAPNEIKNSALRGTQPTNANGTASFLTIVPGHYTGRPNHLHTIVHHGATRLPNNTIQGGTISHVGQFYFDQALLRTIEATSPYRANTQVLIQNSADQIFNMGKTNGDNPIVQTTLLGSNIEGGLYGFIDVGVNPTARRNPRPVNFWTAGGGIPVAGSRWANYPWFKRARAFLGR